MRTHQLYVKLHLQVVILNNWIFEYLVDSGSYVLLIRKNPRKIAIQYYFHWNWAKLISEGGVFDWWTMTVMVR